MIDEKKLTAKEMFETLGWEQDKNNSNVIEYCRGFRSIVFLKYDKEVVPSCHLTMDWLKAINKQCEELGWIEKQPEISLENKTSDKWIPCSERLPKQNERIIGTFYNYEDCRAFVGEDTYFPDILDNPYPLIAWMPLPEPYKGE